MKKYAYLIGIVLLISFLSGCGNEAAKRQTIPDNTLEITSKSSDAEAQSQTISSDILEVKSEWRYDYTKNLPVSGEDKDNSKIYSVAIKVMEAANLCQEEVDVSEFGMPDIINDLGIQTAILADPMCSFAVLEKVEDGVYSIEYSGGIEEHKNRVAQFDNKINDILNTYVIPGNDEETVRQLYDYFVREMDYDYTLYSDMDINIQQGQMLTEIDLLNKLQSEFNPFIYQTGVCSGFAKSFSLLLNQIGIENYLVTDNGSATKFASNSVLIDGSSGGMGHAWNLIKMNDEFYHFDITWEINGIEEWEDEYGSDHIGVKSGRNPVPHFFYGMSDETRNASRASEMRKITRMGEPGAKVIENLPISDHNLAENSQRIGQESENDQDRDSLLDEQLLVNSVAVKVEILSSEEQEDRDTFVLKNDVNDTNYILHVIFPADYSESKPYPVVYMLDGNLEGKGYTQTTPDDFLLVTIGYEDENQFYELRKADYLERADVFLNIMINGILPFIEERYSIDDGQRSLCGWSCGANFAAFTLFQSDGIAKNVFSEYIFCNPILKQNCVNRSLYAYENRYFEREKSLPVTVMWAVAGKTDAMLRMCLQSLASDIERREYTDIDLTIQEYEDSDLYQVWDQALEEFVFVRNG
jgi:enterochelin esterase-like enzyme